MIAQKQRVRITLDIECYDDLNFSKIDWEKVLGIEGDESVDVDIKEVNPF
jgi:hypothetical protein